MSSQKAFINSLIDEINSLRKNPKDYSNKLLPSKEKFSGKILNIQELNIGILTQEGWAAYEEAYKFLNTKAEPVEELTPSKGLCLISRDYLEKVKEEDPTKMGEIDIDTIVDKYGTFLGNLNRAIEFGANTPKQVVINLIVNDGDKTRCQRESLLNKNLRKIGAYHGSHHLYNDCTVIVCCTKYDNKNNENDKIL